MMFEILIVAAIAFGAWKVFGNKGTKESVSTTARTVRDGISQTSQQVASEWDAAKFEARVQSIMADPALVARIIEEDQLRSSNES